MTLQRPVVVAAVTVGVLVAVSAVAYGLQVQITTVRATEHGPSDAQLVALRPRLRPLAGYQLPDWIRISIGTPKENVRCLEALKTVLGKLASP